MVETIPLPEEIVGGRAPASGVPALGAPAAVVTSPVALMAPLATGAIVVCALYFGQALLVPLVLATLLAFVLAPAVLILQRAWLPRTVAVILAVLSASAAIFILGAVVVRQAGTLSAQLPAYQATVIAKWQALASGGGVVARAVNAALPPPSPFSGHAAIADRLVPDGAATLALAGRLAEPLLGPLATAGVVLVFTIFILLYDEDLRDRLVRLVGREDLHRTIFAMNDAARRLSRYFLFQLGLNASFGTLIGAVLWTAGLPGAMLWGILAALMRFVPFIGTFIALTPPLILAVAVTPGWGLAILVFAVFVGTELIMGQVVEPLIYGHSTGLSPIAIIVATAFWALLWGPIGLLLATPLTVCLVVLGRHVETLAFFDVLFGDTSPLSPAETFYQRALEGKGAVLRTLARSAVAETSLCEYYDHVALAGLAMAQRDRARDALTFDRLEGVHAQVSDLLATLGTIHAEEAAPSSLPEAWRAPGAVICVPGRGQLDDLAAEMAVQAMIASGFGAQLVPGAAVGAARAGDDTDAHPGPSHIRLACLSILEEGSTVSGVRYFMARLRKMAPDALIVVALWHSGGDSPMLADLRSGGQDEHLVLSIGELLAYARAMADQKELAHAAD